MAFDHSKFIARFVEEAREHCSRISEGTLNLETAPDDQETVNGLFRSAHTIKGSARMMRLLTIAELANRMEDLLEAVRSNKVPFSSHLSDLLLQSVDALSAMLDQVASGNLAPEAPAGMAQTLADAAAGTAPAAPPPAYAAPAAVVAPPAAEALPESRQQPQTVPQPEPEQPEAKQQHEKQQAQYLKINQEKLDDLIALMGEIISENSRFKRHMALVKGLERGAAAHLELLSGAGASSNVIASAIELQRQTQQFSRSLIDSSIMQEHLINDLQDTALKLRMQPLSTVFDPLRRTVRDIAQDHGKEIDFTVEGGDTELDKKIIERIGDSLIHLIRNSIDHGLEPPDERVAAGKPPRGAITLSAWYDSGCVTIGLRDNGRGLRLDSIREKALTRRLFDEATLATMTRSEIINIIFMPGFSTSPIITDLSGRGVGMDVVRRSIVDELKGSIAIDTVEGKGSTFLLRLPLNLAVFSLFLVHTAGITCAIPATSIVEMLTVQEDELIVIVNKKALRLREQIIPVEELSLILRRSSDTPPNRSERVMVVIRNGEEKLGLLVDDIIAREEMVVKPLPGHLQKLSLVTGVTIGEQNNIINVLNANELIRQAKNTGNVPSAHQEAPEGKSIQILVVDDSYNTREIERSILEAYGYVITTAEDGAEAFAITRERMFDLVVTDVEMPRLDGFSLTEQLRGDSRYRNIPIIIVTSREKDEDKRRGITVGANAYIVKGAFDQSNLLETVKSLIG